MRSVVRQRRRTNPIGAVEETHIEAIGLGLSVMGLGFALSEIYGRREFIYAGVSAGAVLAAVHWKGPPL